MKMEDGRRIAVKDGRTNALSAVSWIITVTIEYRTEIKIGRWPSLLRAD